MNCGEEIRVQDINGANVARFIAQCHGRFIVISYQSYMNGYVLGDWQAVLRELVALAVPAKLTEKTLRAESAANGTYSNIPLTYPLSVSGLADLLGVSRDDVRGQLADLAVETG